MAWHTARNIILLVLIGAPALNLSFDIYRYFNPNISRDFAGVLPDDYALIDQRDDISIASGYATWLIELQGQQALDLSRFHEVPFSAAPASKYAEIRSVFTELYPRLKSVSRIKLWAHAEDKGRYICRVGPNTYAFYRVWS